MQFPMIDYIENLEEDFPSLFQESENLKILMECILKPYMQQQEDLLWLAENILNLDVAEKWHLDWIGSLVNQPRFLVNFNVEPYFGFEGSYNSETFGTPSNPSVGGYWNSRSHFDTSSARRLNDDEYRRIIQAKTIYLNSNCIRNDLVEVVNLITNRTDNVIQTMRNGLVRITTKDTTGLMSYFADRYQLEDTILPIAAGVRLELVQG